MKVLTDGSGLRLSEVIERMRSEGVERLYAKRLAGNDSSKQQIYLGGDWSALNVLPFVLERPDRQRGSPTLYGRLSYSWIGMAVQRCTAPEAKLILYPEYPEVRLSGFLRGCATAPSEALRPGVASAYQSRTLFLGVTTGKAVVALLLTNAAGILQELDRLDTERPTELLEQVPMTSGVSPRVTLVRELGRIHRLGWINAKRLTASGEVPCLGVNCGGYTLEAELRIEANSRSTPDFAGWEVKQHAVSNFSGSLGGAITLMTPEPTGGIYHTDGPEQFVRRFGYPDQSGRDDRMNFGGIHKVGSRHGRTSLELSLRGITVGKSVCIDPDGEIELVTATGEVAASWSFVGLLEHWVTKHAQAAYVPSMARTASVPQYFFGPYVRLGIGTDFGRFVAALRQGAIYLDPGIKLEAASTPVPRLKRRNQFRIASSALSLLYNEFFEQRLDGILP